VRTNPKGEAQGTRSPKSGSAVPRATRRRTVQPASPESGSLTAASEENIQDEIARLAYLLWKERGGNGGSPEEDWLRAEQEILARSRT
jgi:hypothetical protein